MFYTCRSPFKPLPGVHIVCHVPQVQGCLGGAWSRWDFSCRGGMSPLHPLGSPWCGCSRWGMNGAIQPDGRELKAAYKSLGAAGKTCYRQVWGSGRELRSVGSWCVQSQLVPWLLRAAGMLRHPRVEDAPGTCGQWMLGTSLLWDEAPGSWLLVLLVSLILLPSIPPILPFCGAVAGSGLFLGIPSVVTEGLYCEIRLALSTASLSSSQMGMLLGSFSSFQHLFLVSHPNAVGVSHLVPLAEGFGKHHGNGQASFSEGSQAPSTCSYPRSVSPKPLAWFVSLWEGTSGAMGTT